MPQKLTHERIAKAIVQGHPEFQQGSLRVVDLASTDLVDSIVGEIEGDSYAFT